MKKHYITCALAAIISLLMLNPLYAQDTVKRSKLKPVAAAKPAYTTTQAVARSPYPAQQPINAPANTDKSLNGQYQYLLSKLYNYQKPQLSAFYKNMRDTLRVQSKQLKEVQQKLADQGRTVRNLRSDVNAKDQSLSESNSRMDSISLLGIQLSKATYNLIMWGLVIGFGAVAAIVIMQSGSARREARYRVKLYDELDEEYKTYKLKANEKEKKLARELQTARNKLEDLTGNPGY